MQQRWPEAATIGQPLSRTRPRTVATYIYTCVLPATRSPWTMSCYVGTGIFPGI